MPAAAPITDSPWFWLYLFGTAALIALALAAPKYGPRQAQIERQFQGRERALQTQAGEQAASGAEGLSTPERTVVPLRPLFWVLAGVALLGWVAFWLQRRRSEPGSPAVS